MLYSHKGSSLSFLTLSRLLIIVLSTAPPPSDFGFYFISWPSWEIVAPGSRIELGCATNLPSDDIRWLHNHQFISFSGSAGEDQFSWVEKDSQNGSKLILKISKDKNYFKLQEGLYQCVASVGAIVVTSLPGRIEVAYLKSFPSALWNRTVKVEVGSSFRISCPKPESVPDSIMIYYRKGKIIDLAHEKDFFATQSGDLVVLKAGSNTRGWFSCSAYNHVLNETVEYGVHTRIIVKKTFRKNLHENETPRLISSDSTVTTLVGKTVKILCLATNPPMDSLYLSFKNSKPPQQSILDNAVSTMISNVSTNDEGLYRCHAKNHIGASFIDTTILVQDAPFVIEYPKSQSIAEMTNSSLVCVFGGNPIPVVAWVFNGQLITSTGNVLVQGNVLNFHLITRDQSGIYQCFGFSAFGAAHGSAIITVIPMTVTASPDNTGNKLFDAEGASDEEIDELTDQQNNEFATLKHWSEVDLKAPSRPRITKLSDESVMVTWDIDSGDSLPILFFKVQHKMLRGPNREVVNQDWKTVDEDIPPHVKSFEVTELKPDHVYRFRVAAVYVNNDNQLGPSSKRFFLTKDIKLKRPEEAPRILAILPEGKSSALVSWQYYAKVHTEGFIISFREATSAADYSKITLLGESMRNYTVNYLVPNTPYDFKICSFNMAGTSNYSERATYIPKDVNFTFSEEEEHKKEKNHEVPIVRSDPDGISSSILYIALGTGLVTLLIIVVASFLIYSCRNTHATGEAVVESKFMDTSLRIHRTCSAGHRINASQSGCQCICQTENQVPLLALGLNGNNRLNTSECDSRIQTRPNMYGANSSRASNEFQETSEERDRDLPSASIYRTSRQYMIT